LLGGWLASYFFHMGDPMSGINPQSILVEWAKCNKALPAHSWNRKAIESID